MITTTSTMMRPTKITILLSLNAVAILIAGILIASALGFSFGDFHVVSARNDETTAELVQDTMPEVTAVTFSKDQVHASSGTGGIMPDGDTASGVRAWVSSDPVPSGELWNEPSITIYESADIDICIGGGLTGLGDMYWQTSNTSVISGFYSSARTWLGYDAITCRYPIVTGTGTTTISAGTYDGLRKDSIEVNVIPIPIDEWKHEILVRTNRLRAEHGLSELTWGGTCERAADQRAAELISRYSHTRPDGSEWATACEALPGDYLGENLMAGNAATSPELTMEAWINSPAHLKNLLDPAFTKLAVGLVFDPSTKYQIYWSQFFSTY